MALHALSPEFEAIRSRHWSKGHNLCVRERERWERKPMRGRQFELERKGGSRFGEVRRRS